MKIIVQTGAFTHTYDSSLYDKVEDGEIDEYFPSVAEAVDAALTLLWNVYDKREIARVLVKGEVPATEYYELSKKKEK